MKTLDKTQPAEETPTDSAAVRPTVARRSWRVWRNYYPSFDYALDDPRTLYVPIDRAAHMAGCARHRFYDRYLASGRLPYEVKFWFHGKKMRRKSFVLRSALMELLARDLLEAARLQVLKRRPRARSISRRATAADLEREMELRMPHRPRGNQK
jgi:hypothetical protein